MHYAITRSKTDANQQVRERILEAERIVGCWRRLVSNEMGCRIEDDLLALARLALPVGCGTSFLASGLTPNLTAGAGPVGCGTRGCIPPPRFGGLWRKVC